MCLKDISDIHLINAMQKSVYCSPYHFLSAFNSNAGSLMSFQKTLMQTTLLYGLSKNEDETDIFR